jgi:ABC-type sugar transport system substrate-binding protein
MNLLKEVAPQITRVVCMFNPQSGPYSVEISHFAQEAAQSLGVQYVAAPVVEPTQIEPAIATLAQEPNGGLIISRTPSPSLIDTKSSPLPLAIGYLRYTPSAISPSTAV